MPGCRDLACAARYSQCPLLGDPPMQNDPHRHEHGADERLQPVKRQRRPRRPITHEPAKRRHRIQPDSSKNRSGTHQSCRRYAAAEPVTSPIACAPRRCVITTAKRFPYGIFFSISVDTLYVHAVLHGAQHHQRWKRRIRFLLPPFYLVISSCCCGRLVAERHS
jgi:hypothetical protein